MEKLNEQFFYFCIYYFRINDIAVFVRINGFLTMRFYFYLIITIYWLFLILAPLNAYAEEEWTITKMKEQKLSYASVSGEVIHGDRLNFFLRLEDNCEKVWNTFTFYTYEKPGDIYQLEDKNIPIKLNGNELTAKVVLVSPFLMGYRVAFSLGEFPVKEYTHFLHEFYQEEEKYEIEIVDGLNFQAKKYFDITTNNWKLDNLIPKMLEANKVCKEIGNENS